MFTPFTRFLILLPILALCACTSPVSAPDTNNQLKAVISRYNQLLADGYRTMNMNPLQEVATGDQATRLYHHMAALGEAKIRMDSSLKEIVFIKIERPEPGKATVQTKERWDFTHSNLDSGEKFAEERGFIYEMNYRLTKTENRWIISQVDTLSGTSTNTVIPWPKTERKL